MSDGLMDMRRRLLEIVRHSLVPGRLATGDGRVISDYINGHYITCDPEGLDLCARLLSEEIRSCPIDAVCGEVSGSCALVTGITLHAWRSGRPLAGCYIRKEPKSYGLTGLLNAHLAPGSRVVIVDDVTSTGQAACRCVTVLRDLDLDVVGVLTVVDRNEGCREALDSLKTPLRWLFTLEELAQAPESRRRPSVPGLAPFPPGGADGE